MTSVAGVQQCGSSSSRMSGFGRRTRRRVCIGSSSAGPPAASTARSAAESGRPGQRRPVSNTLQPFITRRSAGVFGHKPRLRLVRFNQSIWGRMSAFAGGIRLSSAWNRTRPDHEICPEILSDLCHYKATHGRERLASPGRHPGAASGGLVVHPQSLSRCLADGCFRGFRRCRKGLVAPPARRLSALGRSHFGAGTRGNLPWQTLEGQANPSRAAKLQFKSIQNFDRRHATSGARRSRNAAGGRVSVPQHLEMANLWCTEHLHASRPFELSIPGRCRHA